VNAEAVVERLDRIETLLRDLVTERTVKDWYTVAEAAEILGKAEFTVASGAASAGCTPVSAPADEA